MLPVLAVLAVLTGLTGCGAADPASSPTASAAPSSEKLPSPREYADALLEATNAARTDEGVDALTPSLCARRWAVSRAEALVGEPLGHAPMGEVAADCAPGGRVAENLVDSAAEPSKVVGAWMESAGHRNNIVDPQLEKVGVGCVEHEAVMLCSQLFLEED